MGSHISGSHLPIGIQIPSFTSWYSTANSSIMGQPLETIGPQTIFQTFHKDPFKLEDTSIEVGPIVKVTQEGRFYRFGLPPSVAQLD